MVINSMSSLTMWLLFVITGTGTYFTNSLSPIITVNGDVEAGSNLRIYHLVRPIDEHHYQNNKTSERTHKAIPEIFLTRLLSTKGTIQKFVDDFFNTILTANEALPPAVKWLFDLLDDAARKHSITEPEVVHAWKSNRYVINMLDQLPVWGYIYIYIYKAQKFNYSSVTKGMHIRTVVFWIYILYRDTAIQNTTVLMCMPLVTLL